MTPPPDPPRSAPHRASELTDGISPTGPAIALDQQPRWRRVVALALGYLVLALISRLLALPPGYSSPLWPAAGLAVGALLVWGWRCWPGVWLGSFLFNFWQDSSATDGLALGSSALVAAALGTGAATQAWVGARMGQRFLRMAAPLAREREAFLFLLLCGPLACLIAPTVGVSLLISLGGLPPDTYANNWLAWWVGDSVGVLLFAPLLFVILPETSARWRTRRRYLVVPLLATAALFMASYIWHTRAEESAAQHQIEQDAAALVSPLAAEISRDAHLIRATSRLFSIKETITQEEFARFATVRVGQRGLAALQWIPRVSGGDRNRYEAGGEGGGPIQELDPTGLLVTASPRPEYFPVTFVHPVAPNRAALGFDAASNPVRRAALQEAADLGQLTASAPINLIQNGRRSILVFDPVYRVGFDAAFATVAARRENLTAYVLGIVDLPASLRVMNERAAQRGLAVRATDVGEGSPGQWLWSTSLSPAPAGPAAWTHTVPILGRHWRFEAWPVSEPGRSGGSAAARTFLGLGLASVFGVSLLVLASAGRTLAISREVMVRTADLTEEIERRRASEGHLRRFVEHAPAALAMFDRDMRYLAASRRWQDIQQVTGDSAGRLHSEIVPDMPVRWKDAFRRSLAGELLAAQEDCRDRADGTTQWLRWEILPWRNATGEIGGSLIAAEDITPRKQAAQAEHARLEQAALFQTTLLALRDQEVAELPEFFKLVTSRLAGALNVERVSIWLFDPGHTAIECHDLFLRSTLKHERGLRLPAADYPRYFTALAANNPILADDAHTHPATSEFSAGYLTPLGITSMLDVPIRDCAQQGIVCCEHTGPARPWTPEENRFVLAAASYVALALEQAGRLKLANALRESEALLTSINASLTGTCVYRMLYSPTGAMTCLYVSPNVETLVGVPATKFLAEPATLFGLIHEADRGVFQAAFAAMLRTGADKDVVVRLRPVTDAVRWMQVRSHLVERRPDGSQVRVGVVVDVTAIKAAEAINQQQADFFSTLHKITVELLGRRDEAELLQSLVNRSAALFDTFQVRLNLLEGDTLVARSFHGGSVTRLNERITRDKAPLSWQAVDTGQPVVVDNYLNLDNACEPYRSLGLTAVAILPIMHGDRCLGTLVIVRKPPGRNFSPEEITHGLLFARLAALVLHQAGIYDEAVRATESRTSELRASEARYRALADSSGDAIFLFDGTGIIRSANPAAGRMHGYTQAELVGMNVRDLDTPNAAHQIPARLKRLVEGESLTFEREHRRKDGSRFPLEIVATPLQFGGESFILASQRDITARKRTEQLVQESVALLQATLESTSDGILAIGTDGTIQTFNPKFVTLWHLPAEIIEARDGNRALQFILDQAVAPEQLSANVRQVFAHPMQESFDTLEFKDERTFECSSRPMLVGGQPAGRVWSFRDISERQRSSRALIQALEHTAVLAQLGRALAEADTRRAAALALIEAGCHLLAWDCCGLHFWNEETQHFEDPVNFDRIDGERRETSDGLHAPGPPSTMMMRVMRDGAQLLLRENEDEPAEDLVLLGTHRRSLSLLFAPIRSRDHLLGIVSIQSYRRQAYDQTALELLLTLAERCSGALVRLQAGGALDASEERFRLASVATYDVIWDYNIKTGKTWRNGNFQPLFGYGPEEAGPNGDFSHSCLHPEERERVVAGVLAALGGGSVSWNDNYRFRRKDGTYADVEDRAHIIRDASGQPVRLIGAMRDITERKQNEAALRLAQFSIERAVDSVMWVSPAAEILFVNDTACRLLGYSREELVGLHIPDINPAATVETWAASWTELKQCGSVSFEADHRTKDGRLLPFELTLNFLRFEGREYNCATMRHITDRRAAEAALRHSEQLFRGVFDASPIPIFLSSLWDGRLADANTAALATFGYTREQALGRTTAELAIWARPEQHAEFFGRITSERSVSGFEAILRTSSGATLIMLCTGTRVTIADRPLVLTSAVDITAFRLAETEKAHLQETVFQTQKHQALGTLAGGVAHDFNNILTGILNYTELAKDDCPPTHPQIKHFLGEALKCGLRAKELVRQILLFSRSEDAAQEPVLVQHVIGEVLALLRSTLPATVEIKSSLDWQAPVVLANATQIHQVVLNLGINAAHAMQGQDGLLTVTLRQRSIDAALAAGLSGLQPGPHLCLEVTDTGCGMTPEIVDRIFDPFFTTKKIGEGTGLGLAVVRSIMGNHRGAIRVRSQPGAGTTFELYFPVLGTAAPPSPAERAELPRGRGQRIFLVDDEPTITTSVGLMLQRLNYRVTTFTKADEALARFWTAPDEVDLLITDFQMPGITGLALAQKFLAQRPALPVLIASGFTGGLTVEKIRDNGLSDLLRKPFDLAELARALAKALP